MILFHGSRAYAAAVLLLALRAARLFAWAAAASLTQAPSSHALRRVSMRSLLHGPCPATTRLNSDQSIGPCS